MSARSFLGISALVFGAIVPVIAMAADPPATPPIAIQTREAGAKPPLIATKDFARLPDFSGATLSPDGTKLAFRMRKSGKVQIGYRNVDGGGASIFSLPDDIELSWLRWAGNDQILVSVQSVAYVYGIEVPRTMLLLHTVSTGVTGWISRFNKQSGRSQAQGLIGDDVLYVAPDGKRLVLALSKGLFETPAVFDVSLPDGTMTQIIRERSNIWDWYADEDGVVRIGTGWESGKLRLIYRKDASVDFETIARINPDKEESWYSFAQIVTGSDEGYVLSDKATGRTALHRFNYRTREVGEVVHGHDRFDIDDYSLSADGKSLRAVTFTDDRDRVHWFDPAERRIQTLIDRAVPHLQAWVVSRSADGKKMLVFGSATDDPGVWYVLDRDSREMAILAAEFVGLPPEQLARTQAVTYKSRDGLDVPAYLTLPKGRANKGLPLIIHPHGGPYGVRDKLTYDPHVQFLANRGYAVLQPNYRGSGGYGTSFGDAGIGQIGRKMQDDLDDGMDWLVQQGVVDPARVCIVGASYGGYAAVWGVIRNPERYRCAASYAGVTDWESMLKYDRRYLTKKASDKWRSRITGDGDLLLNDVSPLRQAARLTRPILLAHGKLDSNVPISQSKKFMSALPQTARQLVSFTTFEDEGHSFENPANLERWFEELGAFLKLHNPAD